MGVPTEQAVLRPRRVVPAALVVLLVPLVVSAITVLVRAEPVPIRDAALTELQVRAIGHHAVNLGLYSRDGWSHPGPLIFYSLVVPYRLLGGTAGLLVGALVINGLAAAGIVLVTRRLAGDRAALVVAVATATLVRAYGPALIRDPWVCFVTTLPFGLFLVTVWAMVERRPWALPVSLFLASWLSQTHVGFAPVTVPVLLGATVVLIVRVWRDPEHAVRRRLGWAAVIAVGVAAAVWAPVAWDQIDGRGNFATMVRWFRRPDAPAHTVTEGVRVVLGAFAFPPDFVTGRHRVELFTGETLLRTQWHLPVLLLLVGAGVVVAWRRRRAADLRFAAVLGATVVVSIVAVGRTIGLMYEYRLLWTWTIAALAVALAVWTIWEVSAAGRPRVDAFVTGLLLVMLVALATAQVVRDVQSHDYQSWHSPVTGRVLDQLAARDELRRGVVLLHAPTPASDWYLQGLVLGLAKRGVDARVVDRSGIFVGQGLRRGDRPVAELEVYAESDLGKLTDRRPPGLVAYAGSRSYERQLAVIRAGERTARRLAADFAAGRIDQDQLARGLIARDRHPQALAVVERTR